MTRNCGKPWSPMSLRDMVHRRSNSSSSCQNSLGIDTYCSKTLWFDVGVHVLFKVSTFVSLLFLKALDWINCRKLFFNTKNSWKHFVQIWYRWLKNSLRKKKLVTKKTKVTRHVRKRTEFLAECLWQELIYMIYIRLISLSLFLL